MDYNGYLDWFVWLHYLNIKSLKVSTILKVFSHYRKH